MISVIADVLKNKLDNLEWIERFGGLVSNATRPVLKQGADGVQVVTGYQTYPVACGVNLENCWENGRFKHFEPDSTKSAIAFFVDNGGVQLRENFGPKLAWLKFEFDLKFLMWLNNKRLGEAITAGNCLPAGRIAPYVVAQLFGTHTAVGVFGGDIEEEIFGQIEVTGVRELRKNPGMFEPFSFASDGDKRGLFIEPYDYFGLQLTGSFVINKNCLPDFGADWEPATGCGTWQSAFCTRVFNCLDSLPEFDSEEAALIGGTADEQGNIWYITAQNHKTLPGGIPKIATA